MSPPVFELFESLLARRVLKGPVLEIGATRDADTLLNLPSLRSRNDRTGINIADCGAGDPAILPLNANDLSAFPDGHFGLVLCNSVLEHDLYFWRTLAEAKRVTARGGTIAIGVPGYRGMGMRGLLPKWCGPLLTRRRRVALAASTATLGEHLYPDDYYRFSEAAVRTLFMSGLSAVEVHEVMTPPRFVGIGTKP